MHKIKGSYPDVDVTGTLSVPTYAVASRLGMGHDVRLMIRDNSTGVLERYTLTATYDDVGEVDGFRVQHANRERDYTLPADLGDCTCPDSEHRHRPNGCRHRRALTQVLEGAGVLAGA